MKISIRNWIQCGAIAAALAIVTPANASLIESSEPLCDEQSVISSDLNTLTYFQLGAGTIGSLDDFGKGDDSSLAPAFSVGRRYELSDWAVDISCGFSSHGDSFAYTAPKLMFLNYSDPEASSSLFYGAGLSYGGLEQPDSHQKFRGLFGNAALGYELHRHDQLRVIVQLEVSKALVATKQKGDAPEPTVAMTLGWGF